MPPELLTLAGITLVAATINGALGYGFSSITVPLALFFFTNRVLNPALVLLEVVLNANVLWVNRAKLPMVRRRVLPIIIGLVPGVVAGTFLLKYVNPGWIKLATYVALLPLILVQAAGFRRPIKAERSANLAFGSGVGVLYSVTTISGPPLAIIARLCFTGSQIRYTPAIRDSFCCATIAPSPGRAGGSVSRAGFRSSRTR